jgi:hypothetical protein
MAMPFRPLSTEKLEIYFKTVVERSCGIKETDQCRKKPSGKISRNKLLGSARVSKTRIQREINL